jgi:hypothetical protein
MVKHKRYPLKLTSYSYRFAALKAKDFIVLKRIKRNSIKLANVVVELRNTDAELSNKLYNILLIMLCKYRSIFYTDQIPQRVRHVPISRTIDSFSQSECWTRFCFMKDDLYRLLRVFRLDNHPIIVLDNGAKLTNEELLLFCINRYVSGSKIIELVAIYGRDWSVWSRAFVWFSVYMRINFAFLLFNNIDYWVDSFPKFSESIRNKLIDVSEGNIVYAPNSYSIAFFYDDTITMTCRPLGGPAESGTKAPRYNTLIQQSFYSGWKHGHGFKYQTCELPNGMCMHLDGPYSIKLVC